jgi:hypothetical protein
LQSSSPAEIVHALNTVGGRILLGVRDDCTVVGMAD